MTESKGPYQGVKIIDLSTVIAGPMAATLLAEQGADVIKVEAQGMGDIGRYLGSSRNGMSSCFHLANRGKRSIAIDLKKERGVAVLKKLIADADVLLQNFRPGVMQKLGIDYPALSAINKQLVYVSITGFGDTGPMAQMSAYDNIVQSFCGFAALQQDPQTGEPALIRNILTDKLTAINAAQAIGAALYARTQGSDGQHIRLSMLDSSMAFLWGDSAMEEALLGDGVQLGEAPAKRSKLTRFKNGWISVSPVTDNAFHGMMRVLSIEGADDERLQSVVSRMTNPELMAQILQRWEDRAASVDVDEAVAQLQAADVPCAKVMSLAELPGHPQVVANNIFRETDHPVMGRLREPRPAAQFSQTPSGFAQAAPMLGEHSDEIIREIGLEEELSSLREEGVIA